MNIPSEPPASHPVPRLRVHRARSVVAAALARVVVLSLLAIGFHGCGGHHCEAPTGEVPCAAHLLGLCPAGDGCSMGDTCVVKDCTKATDAATCASFTGCEWRGFGVDGFCAIRDVEACAAAADRINARDGGADAGALAVECEQAGCAKAFACQGPPVRPCWTVHSEKSCNLLSYCAWRPIQELN